MTNPFSRLLPDGSLVVSCQASGTNPLRDSGVMALMARCAEVGGAAGIRANGPDDVAAIAAAVTLPVIGIHKLGDPTGVYITPTVEAAIGVIDAGAAIVALDGTERPRDGGVTLAEQIAGIRRYRDVPVMADVDSLEAGLRARDAGADAIATTLSGYTGARVHDGVDIDLIAALVSELDCPVVAEGRLRTDDDVARARRAGASVLVIGTAITNPIAITRAFVRALGDARAERARA
jgi:N-acylglucosamine-6-phosphate 2-epimerase